MRAEMSNILWLIGVFAVGVIAGALATNKTAYYRGRRDLMVSRAGFEVMSGIMIAQRLASNDLESCKINIDAQIDSAILTLHQFNREKPLVGDAKETLLDGIKYRQLHPHYRASDGRNYPEALVLRVQRIAEEYQHSVNADNQR